MPKIEWDKVGERLFETGVDHGVLYLPNAQGVFDTGVPWNGLTGVTEAPSGAESTPTYADNRKYVVLVSPEEFGATIEALTYPPEFGQFDGTAAPAPGVYVSQQSRRPFGFSYRSLIGNDLEGTDFGYKLHLVYNATAAPTEKARTTVNDSPEPMGLSWEVTTDAVAVGTINGVEYKPTSHLIIDSTEVEAADLLVLEAMLYGDADSEPELPLPADVIALFSTVTP